MENKLVKNILLFTSGLALLTVSIEVFKRGHLQIEEPLAFFIAILVLGVIGGYTITWVAQSKQR